MAKITKFRSVAAGERRKKTGGGALTAAVELILDWSDVPHGRPRKKKGPAAAYSMKNQKAVTQHPAAGPYAGPALSKKKGAGPKIPILT